MGHSQSEQRRGQCIDRSSLRWKHNFQWTFSRSCEWQCVMFAILMLIPYAMHQIKLNVCPLTYDAYASVLYYNSMLKRICKS